MSKHEELLEELTDLKRMTYDASAAVVKLQEAMNRFAHTDWDGINQRMKAIGIEGARARAESYWCQEDVYETAKVVTEAAGRTNSLADNLLHMIKLVDQNQK